MSKEKKSKKARKPNVPMYTGPVLPTASGGGGGSVAVEGAAATPRLARSETIEADYTHVVADLKRIGLLAGGLIAVLVALSFFIK
ncbi:MAG TPA: hypothetical protein VI547_01105 [Anaerolineales bacterium]|nr:hypothetical protein [Anaerolineales bacterium]